MSESGIRTSEIFRLDSGSGVPFYRQIIDRVLLALADGRLTPGMQLPTVRQLAVDLAVNLNTVARAYKEMEIRKIVHTQQGSGTFVARRDPSGSEAARRKALRVIAEQAAAAAADGGFTLPELIEALQKRMTEAGHR